MLAHRTAASRGLTGDDYTNRVQEIYDNPPDSVKRTRTRSNYSKLSNSNSVPSDSRSKLHNTGFPGTLAPQPFFGACANISKQEVQRFIIGFSLQQNYEDV